MALKVFDLSCEHDHVFEGWFSSQDSFQDQLARGLVRCPVCHSDQITRRVSAPRLNISHLRAEPSAPRAESAAAARAAVAAPSGDQMARLQAEVLRQIRRIVRQTDDVGARFADEARRMHSGEIEERPIRGTASVEECRELVDEGISIMPIPDILDDDRLQ
ncbi:MAG: DUF1178 family protein [Castellaniella sp.]|uniref:DUF1178 family protein n=1 Tax=Castellaniella sp. TaxID=1955812 RepID=UPI002A35EAAB|nr:DUF1178 family protein [Castellaniella sp.]MDY0310202.1 DUF1178 family protein [Castellaniella sp.]